MTQPAQTAWILYRFLLGDYDIHPQQMSAAFGGITSWFCLSHLVAILGDVHLRTAHFNLWSLGFADQDRGKSRPYFPSKKQVRHISSTRMEVHNTALLKGGRTEKKRKKKRKRNSVLLSDNGVNPGAMVLAWIETCDTAITAALLSPLPSTVPRNLYHLITHGFEIENVPVM